MDKNVINIDDVLSLHDRVAIKNVIKERIKFEYELPQILSAVDEIAEKFGKHKLNINEFIKSFIFESTNNNFKFSTKQNKTDISSMLKPIVKLNEQPVVKSKPKVIKQKPKIVKQKPKTDLINSKNTINDVPDIENSEDDPFVKQYTNTNNITITPKVIPNTVRDVVSSDDDPFISQFKAENNANNNNYDKPTQVIESKYVYPTETYEKVEHTDDKNGPYGNQHIHDVQTDDTLSKREIALTKQYEKLAAIEVPEQKSAGWFEMRDQKITASDSAVVLNSNPYEPQYTFILKKTKGKPFNSNKFCYHGTKYERIATMIYEYRMNIIVTDFGLLGHPTHKFLGASPDGICSTFKADGKTKTNLVGRMLEIKCPFVRKIKTTGEIKDGICPLYYWTQVQQQLECCDLDKCDFWQCELLEYSDRTDFLNDTDEKEPYRSLSSGFEKGCLIQLLPLEKLAAYAQAKADDDDAKCSQIVYDASAFIHPPKIEMSPYECDVWISQTLANLNTTHPNHVLNRVMYWKLESSHCVTIDRDQKWFDENLPLFDKMWKYVEFFRKNSDKLDILVGYIDSLKIKTNKKIMAIVEKIYDNRNKSNYETILESIKDETQTNLNIVRVVKPAYQKYTAKTNYSSNMFEDN